MERYVRERADLEDKKKALGAIIRERSAELQALDTAPPAAPLDVDPDAPTFVRFSRVSGDIDGLLAGLANVYEAWGCRLRRVIQLAPSSGENDGGLAHAAPPTEHRKLETALALLPPHAAFGLISLASDAGALPCVSRRRWRRFSSFFFKRIGTGGQATLPAPPPPYGKPMVTTNAPRYRIVTSKWSGSRCTR